MEEAPFKSRLFFLSLHDASPQRAWLCVGVHTISFGVTVLHDKPCPDLQSQVGPVSHETKELTAHAHPTSVASQLVLLRRFGAARQLGMGEVIDVMIGRLRRP